MPARRRHLPLLQLDGHAAHRIPIPLQFTKDGRELLGAVARRPSNEFGLLLQDAHSDMVTQGSIRSL